MNLLRDTDDHTLRYEFLEAFWESQVTSKHWLITELKEALKISLNDVDSKIGYVFGGWHGLCAMFLIDNIQQVSTVYSIDMDIKNETNGIQLTNNDSRIIFKTERMENFSTYQQNPSVIVNTSTEHITQKQYDSWLENIPKKTWVVLQGNNYDLVEEHIRTTKNLQEFKEKNPLDVIFYAGELDCKQFTRYMTIGYKL